MMKRQEQLQSCGEEKWNCESDEENGL